MFFNSSNDIDAERSSRKSKGFGIPKNNFLPYSEVAYLAADN